MAFVYGLSSDRCADLAQVVVFGRTCPLPARDRVQVETSHYSYHEPGESSVEISCVGEGVAQDVTINAGLALLGLLFYGYATGVFSSRKIEKATYESIPFRYIAGGLHPDHDTLASFRRKKTRPFYVSPSSCWSGSAFRWMQGLPDAG